MTAALRPPDRPIRVLRLIARLNTGGPARHVAWLTRGLRAFNYHTTLATGVVEPPEASMEDDLRTAGLEWTRLSALRRSLGLHDLRAFFQVLALLRTTRPEILHTHTAKAGFLGRLAALVVNLFRAEPIRVVHTFHGHTLHGYHGPLAERVFLLLERFLGRFATDRIVVLSPAQRDELAERFRIAPRDRFVVVPLGLDLTPFENLPPRGAVRARLGLAEDAFLVGAVGRLAPIKNLGVLIEAVARTDPSVHLLLVGEGEEEAELRVRAERCGVTERVHFWGGETNVARIYADLDLLALSSRNEGTPLSAIEAMASGVPVVGTAVGGLVDLLDDRRGLLVPPDEVDSLADAIERLRRDENLRRDTAARARAYVRTTHALPRLLESLDRLYRALLPARGGI